DVRRSEAVRSAQTPVRVLMPAPGDFVYVHAFGRAGDPAALGQVGGSRTPAKSQRAVPAERSLVRAYLIPQAKGGWHGAGDDWFDVSSNQPVDAGPADLPPLVEQSEPSAPGERPGTVPTVQRGGRSALLALGLTGEVVNAQRHTVIRVTTVDAGGPAQHA